MPAVISSIENIIIKAKKYLPALDEARVMRAYHFAEEAHKGQTRFSGDPYIIHPLTVTSILLDFHPDEDSIVTALLHDVAEDTNCTLEEIEMTFGKNISELCSGLVKLSKVRSKLDDPQTENLRKLFLAMAKDFRVVLIKLCDRLHNMMTLEHVRPEKQTRIAQETLNIYSPIAARLGIYRMKLQLEDLCFKYLNPQDYERIQGELAKTGKWRERYIEIARGILGEALSNEGIQAVIDGRVKSLYSIYRKLKKKNRTSVEDIFDVFAMRIILPDIYKYGKEYIGHVYTTLGVLHSNFTPLAHRFKDYIAVPKVNGYRSLHTTIMGLGPKVYTQPTEVQIRTHTMHLSAELGIAAHWMYEEDKMISEGTETQRLSLKQEATLPFLQQQQKWISGLQTIGHEITDNQEFMENLRVDIFQDRIFVLTPRGDVRDLPAQATPIDFAYAVHTEIGNHCIGSKVNGNIVPLDYELKSGDVVEILIRKNAHPNYQWLSVVKTNHARNRIRSWFRQFDEDKHFSEGKELLNSKLKQFGFDELDDNLSLLKNYDGKTLSVRDRRIIIIEIGKCSLFPGAALRKIFTMKELLMNREQGDLKKKTQPSKKAQPHRVPRLFIGGAENMPYSFVRCCNASVTENDELIGFTTRGRGVSVHRKACKIVRSCESHRLIPVQRAASFYPVNIILDADDRVGLIRDISKIIADAHINIGSMDQSFSDSKRIHIECMVEIATIDQLEHLLYKLEKIPNVRRAYKAN